MRYFINVTSEDGELLKRISVAMGNITDAYNLNVSIGRAGAMLDITDAIQAHEKSKG